MFGRWCKARLDRKSRIEQIGEALDRQGSRQNSQSRTIRLTGMRVRRLFTRDLPPRLDVIYEEEQTRIWGAPSASCADDREWTNFSRVLSLPDSNCCLPHTWSPALPGL